MADGPRINFNSRIAYPIGDRCPDITENQKNNQVPTGRNWTLSDLPDVRAHREKFFLNKFPSTFAIQTQDKRRTEASPKSQTSIHAAANADKKQRDYSGLSPIFSRNRSKTLQKQDNTPSTAASNRHPMQLVEWLQKIPVAEEADVWAKQGAEISHKLIVDANQAASPPGNAADNLSTMKTSLIDGSEIDWNAQIAPFNKKTNSPMIQVSLLSPNEQCVERLIPILGGLDCHFLPTAALAIGTFMASIPGATVTVDGGRPWINKSNGNNPYNSFPGNLEKIIGFNSMIGKVSKSTTITCNGVTFNFAKGSEKGGDCIITNDPSASCTATAMGAFIAYTEKRLMETGVTNFARGAPLFGEKIEGVPVGNIQTTSTCILHDGQVFMDLRRAAESFVASDDAIHLTTDEKADLIIYLNKLADETKQRAT